MAFFQEADSIRFCLNKLAEIHGSSLKLIKSQPVGGGCINNALKLSTSEGEFFLKWNSNAPKDMFGKEAAGLTEMSQSDSLLVIPKVIFYAEPGDSSGLLLMEYLQPATNTLGFDEKLGRGLAQMHRKSAGKFGFQHSNYCGTTVQNNSWTASWPEFYSQNRIDALVKQIKRNRALSVNDQKIYDKLIDRLPNLLPHSTIPSLIHGDLWSGNYMFTAKGPALIDPACYYADREMELGMMKLFGGFSTKVWAAYQEEWPLPDDWQHRNLLYQLYHVLNHYLLFGGSYGWQALDIAKRYL